MMSSTDLEPDTGSCLDLFRFAVTQSVKDAKEHPNKNDPGMAPDEYYQEMAETIGSFLAPPRCAIDFQMLAIVLKSFDLGAITRFKLDTK